MRDYPASVYAKVLTYKRLAVAILALAVLLVVTSLEDGLVEALLYGVMLAGGMGLAGALFVWYFADSARHEKSKADRPGPSER